MGTIFSKILEFFKPVTIFFISVPGLIAFLVGALADPQGFINQSLCFAIDMIAALFPSTPEGLKVASIINLASEKMPLFGRGIISEIASTIGIIFGLTLVIKIYKLIPFKAS